MDVHLWKFVDGERCGWTNAKHSFLTHTHSLSLFLSLSLSLALFLFQHHHSDRVYKHRKRRGIGKVPGQKGR